MTRPHALALALPLALALALPLALSGTAAARLGETPAECAARYGAPRIAAPDGTRTTHRSGHIELHITYREGRAASILYRRAPASLWDLTPRLSADDVAAILQATASPIGQPWLEVPAEEIARATGLPVSSLMFSHHFRRADGQALAIHDTSHGSLHLMTEAEHLRRIHEAAQAAAAAAAASAEKSRDAARNF